MVTAAQIDRLNSLIRQVQRIAFDGMERGVDSAAMMALLCQTVPSNAQKRVTLEWALVYPQLKEWVDQRQRQKVFGEDITILLKNYEMTYDYDVDRIEDVDALVDLGLVARALGEAAPSETLFEALRPLRLNKPTFDGEDFFGANHIRLDQEGAVFSNLVPVTWVAARPTLDEARSALDAAKSRLLTNRLLKRKIIEAASLNKDILVVTSDVAVFEVFNRLLTDTDLPGGLHNDLKGTFRLFYDQAAYAGPTQRFDVYLSGSGDPKPVIFTERKKLMLRADATKAFETNQASIGMDGRFGSTTGFPQSAVRVTTP